MRFFLSARVLSADLEVLAFRLPFSTASCEEMEGLERARTEGESGRDELATAGGSGPRSSDSGIKRRPIGALLVSTLFPWLRLGRPRAAAAPMESSVVREARRAAS